MQMALRSFEQVVASPAFLSMPIAFVRALISDDKLIAREEQPVFEVCIACPRYLRWECSL